MMTGQKREAIRLRLMELEQANNGRLTPKAVEEDARSPESPLHDQFQWDDTKAAYAFRLDQARTLITSVLVVQRTETTTVSAVYYVRDPSAAGNEQGYVSVPTLRTDEDAARAALVNAFRAAGDLLRRAQHLALVLGMEMEVRELVNGVVQLRDRIDTQPPQQM